MFLTLILIALFPLSAAEQNETNPKNKEKLFKRQRVFFLRGLILWREGIRDCRRQLWTNGERVSLLTFFCTCKESKAIAGRDRHNLNSSGTVPAVKGAVPYCKPVP
jgi:hypothetical protein